MGFSRQEYWSGLLYPTPGDLPNPGIEPVSLASPVLAGEIFTILPPGNPLTTGLPGNSLTFFLRIYFFKKSYK